MLCDSNEYKKNTASMMFFSDLTDSKENLYDLKHKMKLHASFDWCSVCYENAIMSDFSSSNAKLRNHYYNKIVGGRCLATKFFLLITRTLSKNIILITTKCSNIM